MPIEKQFFAPPARQKRLAIAVALLMLCAYLILALVDYLTAESPLLIYDVSFDISPAGNIIVFTSTGKKEERDIFLLHLQTGQVTAVKSTPALERYPAFSPDGESLVYAARAVDGRIDSIFAQSLDGKFTRQLTHSDTSDVAPAFTPDGAQIVFNRAHRYIFGGLAMPGWAHWDLYSMQSDGTKLQRTTEQGYAGMENSKISRDGKSILFATSFPAIDSNIYLLKEMNQPPSALTQDGMSTCPVFSRDGQRIFFIRRNSPYANAKTYLASMSVGGTDKQDIVELPHTVRKCVLSPDGKSIYYLAPAAPEESEYSAYELWRIRVAGGKPEMIADSELFDDPLNWKSSFN